MRALLCFIGARATSLGVRRLFCGDGTGRVSLRAHLRWACADSRFFWMCWGTLKKQRRGRGFRAEQTVRGLEALPCMGF